MGSIRSLPASSIRAVSFAMQPPPLRHACKLHKHAHVPCPIAEIAEKAGGIHKLTCPNSGRATGWMNQRRRVPPVESDITSGIGPDQRHNPTPIFGRAFWNSVESFRVLTNFREVFQRSRCSAHARRDFRCFEGGRLFCSNQDLILRCCSIREASGKPMCGCDAVRWCCVFCRDP